MTSQQVQPINKYCLYKQPDNMDDNEVIEFKAHSRIRVSDLNGLEVSAPKPVRNLDDAFYGRPMIVAAMKRAFTYVPEKGGFESPTPMQQQAWPIILAGHDMLGIADTGAGKSMAYLLPALVHVEEQVAHWGVMISRISRRHGHFLECKKFPTVLVIAYNSPDELRFLQYKDIKCIRVEDIRKQHELIKVMKTEDPDIVVGTPQGFLRLLPREDLDVLSRVSLVIVDGVELMTDLDDEAITCIFEQIRPDRQVVIMANKWSKRVQLYTTQYLTNDPRVVTIGYGGGFSFNAV